MEQRCHFVVGQQRGLIADRRREITGQERDRLLQVPAQIAVTNPAIRHPGAATFAFAGVWVQVEPGQRLTVTADLVDGHIFVPDLGIIDRTDPDAEQALGYLKEPGDHPVGREVRSQHFVGDLIPVLAQFLAIETDVPGLQAFRTAFVPGKCPELLEFFLGHGTGLLRQFAKETEHFFRRARHFACQGALSIAVKPDQLRLFVPAPEDIGHDRGVVPFTRERPQFRGPGDERLVHLFAQRSVFAEGHDRQETGRVEGQKPALHLALLGCLARAGLGRFGHPGKFRLVGNLFAPGLGGVQHIV